MHCHAIPRSVILNLPRQPLLTSRRTGQAGAEINVLATDHGPGASRQLLPGGPNLPLLSLFSFPMTRHDLFDRALEVQRPLFHPRVHFAVDEHPREEIPLCQVAEILVLLHDALVDFVDVLEVFVGGVYIAEDFVLDEGFAGAARNEALGVEEVWSIMQRVSNAKWQIGDW